MSKATLPTPESNAGKAEWSEVYANDKALRESVNSVANEQLAGSIEDAKLASPNNSVYRTIFLASSWMGDDQTANTYIVGSQRNEQAVGENAIAPTAATLYLAGSTFGTMPAPPVLVFDKADYTVAGKSLKLRVKAAVITAKVAPAMTFTFGLYPFKPATGGGSADLIQLETETVVSGSTAAIASPSKEAITRKSGEDFEAPADGAYLLGVATSGTLANESAVLISAQVQMRHT